MRDQIRDRFEIEEEIGSGGMAMVHKAVQKALDRPVAIKELKKEFHGDRNLIERFEREARVAASLQHENVVHVYDYWGAPDYCLVMEYIDGTDLADIIERTGPLPVDVGIMIALQVLNALGFAHGREVIHRDIKPSNIMITRSGEVKLADFGVAFARNLPALTQPGVSMGTPSYMAPEQLMGGQADARSDIFSLGIVLYEMFTAKNPFESGTIESVTAKVLAAKYPSPRRLNRDIPLLLQWVVGKCLRKKPQRRYATADELEKALGKRLRGKTNKDFSRRRIAGYLAGAGVFAQKEGAETAAPVVPVSGQYLRTLAVAAAVLTLLTGAVGYALWKKMKDRPVPPAASTAPQSAVTSTITPTLSLPQSLPTVTAPPAPAQ